MNLGTRNLIGMMALLAVLSGCLSATKPKDVVLTSSDQIDQNFCVGEKLTNSPFANSNDFGADGDSRLGAFIICNSQQFLAIASSTDYLNKWFFLGKDVDFSSVAASDMTAIGNITNPFRGHFNGNGYSLTNFRYETITGNQIGIFGVVYSPAVIENFTAGGVVIRGLNEIGGLVGYNNGGDIKNVSVTVSSILGVEKVGGIIGYNLNGTLTQANVSYLTSSGILGDIELGGAVGRNEGGVLKSVNVTATNITSNPTFRTRVGGLVGYSTGAIRDSVVSLSSIEGLSVVGGLVGKNEGEVFNSLARVVNVNGTNEEIGGLIGHNTGRIVLTQAISTGTIDGSFHIGGLIGHNQAGGDVSDSSADSRLIIGTSFGTGGLIGANLDATVTNCWAKNSQKIDGNQRAGGLIGSNTNGVVTDSWADSEQIRVTGNQAGGLVGENQTSNILDSHAIVNDEIFAGDDAGGLLGYNSLGNVWNSWSKVNKITSSNDTGGLIGEHRDGEVDNCHVEASGLISGASNTGGFIGQNQGGIISRSWAKVYQVTGTTNTGGFVGSNIQFDASNLGSITMSYVEATDVITGTTPTGGFVGLNDDPTISNCYARAKKLVGTTLVGGFAGRLSQGEILQSYAYMPEGTNGTGVSVGGFVGDFNGADITIGNIEDSFTVGLVSGADVPSSTIGKFGGSSTLVFTKTYFDDVKACTDTGAGLCNTNDTAVNTLLDAIYFMNPASPPMDTWDFTTIWKSNLSTTEFPTLNLD